MDRVGADYFAVLKQIREKLLANPVTLQIPIGQAEDFVGMVDLVEMKALYWDGDGAGSKMRVKSIPAELEEQAQEFRDKLLEAASECDDILMEKYIGGEVPTTGEIRRALRAGCISQKLVPMIGGASFKNKGVQPILDCVVDYLPSPLDMPPVVGSEAGRPDHPDSRKPSVDEPFAALAFKIMNDPSWAT